MLEASLLTYALYFMAFTIAVALIRALYSAIVTAGKRARIEASLAPAERAKQEALFQATFPDLQPYFHPEKVLRYVSARRARGVMQGRFTWKNPPGFAG